MQMADKAAHLERKLSSVSKNINSDSSSNFRVELQLCYIFSCFPDLRKKNNSFVHIPADQQINSWKIKQPSLNIQIYYNSI